MSIDVSQFHQVFFEESFDGLDMMEMGLLSLHEGEPDIETINNIFRVAHSIKGGAGTFGFSSVSEFTHGLETLLDEMRNGERDITTDAVNVMLEALDVIRNMLNAVQQQAEPDDERTKEVAGRLQALLNSDSSSQTDVDTTETKAETTSGSGWLINFKPHPHLLQTGNDPVRIFNELAELGDMTVKVDDKALPAFTDLEAEESYLAWEISLLGDISRDEVNEIFEWVEGDCDLSIVSIQNEDTKEDTAAGLLEPADKETIHDPEPEPVKTVEAKKNVVTEKATSSIRVGTEKVDSLINLVGELVITQSMLSQLGENFDPSRLTQLTDGLEQLERNTRELQEGIMRIRMLPISFAFNRFPRLVHDLSAKMGKQVELKLTGEQTELDKTVMEKIGDPLVHLVRNSLDHGLETPEKRRAAGKSEIGQLHLNAYYQGGNIVIEVSDDGAGLNEERIIQKAIDRGLVAETEQLTAEKINDLIFLPGFSTTDIVSDDSGRGVGMDVVKKNINSLGGSVEVKSEAGTGATFTIRLPLTLAIMDGQMIQVADQKYIIPLISIIESLEIKPGTVKNVTGKGEVYALRDEYVPLIRLADVFNLQASAETLEQGLLVVVESDDSKVGLFVDELLAQQQVVIKSLETNYRKVMGVSGATILGDGTVALILDISGLLALYRDPSLIKFKQSIQAA
ncbi:Signal transduction histidine kinase CheA [Methylophaga thiooxydans]|uniref:Chemotaxis protein CheA n=1 Tax=Methylophaga thiooxydans TaxID=392484 RepID=A0A0A0BK33_9GAMM|nr:chemotaxis protein CheA [Methylophaga thiooxydans]KGM08210.1 Signal transduction histidine kinase CheA [Methylophaga thiooxydans]